MHRVRLERAVTVSARAKMADHAITLLESVAVRLASRDQSVKMAARQVSMATTAINLAQRSARQDTVTGSSDIVNVYLVSSVPCVT